MVDERMHIAEPFGGYELLFVQLAIGLAKLRVSLMRNLAELIVVRHVVDLKFEIKI
jgi:hypothetical protein